MADNIIIAKKPQSMIKTALLLFGYQLIIAFVSLLLAPVLMSENTALRAALNAVLIAGCMGVYYTLGGSLGFGDASTDATRVKHGQPKLYYSAKRILFAALLASLPLILIGIYSSIVAKPYTYMLQDLPPWLSAYSFIPEVGAPLELYNAQTAATIGNYITVAQRFILLPFVNLFAIGGDAGSYLFEKIAYLPALVFPLSYFAGYLTGPSKYKKEKDFIESAKKKPKMRLKKEAKKRVNQKREPERLI
jgi:hypothetical protein